MTVYEILVDSVQMIRFVDFFLLQKNVLNFNKQNVFHTKRFQCIPGFGADDGFVVTVVGVCGLDGMGNVEPVCATPEGFVVPGVGGNLGSIELVDGVNGVLDPDRRFSACPLCID